MLELALCIGASMSLNFSLAAVPRLVAKLYGNGVFCMILDSCCFNVFVDVIGDIFFVICPRSDSDNIKQWVV